MSVQPSARDQHFRINTPKVVRETFDDEVVIINLDRGSYYSLRGVGASIWALIEKGLDMNELLDVVAARFEGDRDELERAVQEFIATLRQEELVSPIADGAHRNGRTAASGPAAADHPEKARFETPILQKFTDMQELLLLDPIHEVDESGWPNPL